MSTSGRASRWLAETAHQGRRCGRDLPAGGAKLGAHGKGPPIRLRTSASWGLPALHWSPTPTPPGAHAVLRLRAVFRSVVKYGRDERVLVDFNAAVNDEKARALYLFQPRLDGNEALLARALKATWFEAILSSRKRMQHGKQDAAGGVHCR